MIGLTVDDLVSVLEQAYDEAHDDLEQEPLAAALVTLGRVQQAGNGGVEFQRALVQDWKRVEGEAN